MIASTRVQELRDICVKIIAIAQRLHQKNMLAGADGNISVRVSPQEILITPSGVAKAFMDSSEMALVDIQNEVLIGNASSERLMHLEVYRQCPNARAVVHAHPPTAIAWSIAHPELKALPSNSMSELILACGDIPIVPYARPGSEMMGENLRNYLNDYRALILARHGALTWGDSLEEAWRGMERIEHTAEILWRANQLGGLTPLPDEELAFLRLMRESIGKKLL
jgi:L-fuculose-phosphate aldolase